MILLKKTSLLGFLIAVAFASCRDENLSSKRMETFTHYYSSLKELPEERWQYTADTVSVWYDEKKGNPIRRFKGKPSTSGWKEWDKEMNSISRYDTLWYDQQENAIIGYFYENNDFYELIGKGPTKTRRSYWFDEQGKIHEILYYWIPDENTTTAEHLAPIVAWARIHDSIEIKKLYPNGKIVPSEENAQDWKKLLRRYHHQREKK